ncbi:MAG TPA: DUF427 domain-containing protein [Candidatus Limnocylindria bacterium]|nr:DUF427 domain-containing protein [Candidatus Limnocylindria bacterium]
MTHRHPTADGAVESVWDYPRPPIVVPSDRRVRIEHAGTVVADTRRAVRVLETAGAPAWYLPRADVRMELLRPAPRRRTVCEWKGEASYFDLVVGGRVSQLAAWTYEHPRPGYEGIAGHVAFYAGRVDRALVDDEPAHPQPGGFYGGWVTADVVGPFKGGPGTEAW